MSKQAMLGVVLIGAILFFVFWQRPAYALLGGPVGTSGIRPTNGKGGGGGGTLGTVGTGVGIAGALAGVVAKIGGLFGGGAASTGATAGVPVVTQTVASVAPVLLGDTVLGLAGAEAAITGYGLVGVTAGEISGMTGSELGAAVAAGAIQSGTSAATGATAAAAATPALALAIPVAAIAVPIALGVTAAMGNVAYEKMAGETALKTATALQQAPTTIQRLRSALDIENAWLRAQLAAPLPWGTAVGDWAVQTGDEALRRLLAQVPELGPIFQYGVVLTGPASPFTTFIDTFGDAGLSRMGWEWFNMIQEINRRAEAALALQWQADTGK